MTDNHFIDESIYNITIVNQKIKFYKDENGDKKFNFTETNVEIE